MKKDLIFYSQSDQDRWVCEMLDYKTGCFFLDIGAYDGIQTSNTYTLEKDLDWNGICIEANSSIFEKLNSNRRSKNINAAVTNFDGRINFGIDRIGGNSEIVDCFKLDSILRKNKSPKKIEYLSIDVEGHELDILECFDFSDWEIILMTVEHNLYCDGPEKKESLFQLLSKRGFIRVLDNAVCLDKSPGYYHKPYEDWYINSNYSNIIEKMKKFSQF